MTTILTLFTTSLHCFFCDPNYYLECCQREYTSLLQKRSKGLTHLHRTHHSLHCCLRSCCRLNEKDFHWSWQDTKIKGCVFCKNLHRYIIQPHKCVIPLVGYVYIYRSFNGGILSRCQDVLDSACFTACLSPSWTHSRFLKGLWVSIELYRNVNSWKEI
jgi:hypothetical protein